MLQKYINCLHILQYIAFIFAEITNGFLIFQILTKTEKIVGSYKYLMLIFAIFSSFYGWIEILTQPLMHVKGPIYVVFMTSPLKEIPFFGTIMVCIFCSSFAMVISLLAAQFLYRYFVLCRQDPLKFFEGTKLIIIFIPCFICTFIWFNLAFWFANSTVEKQDFLRQDLEYYYDVNSTVVPLSAMMFWSVKENGDKNWMIPDLIAASGCGFIVYGCFAIITFCAWKTYFTLKNMSSLMSSKSLKINKQLFRTLVSQTILPIITIFIPSGIVLTLPLLDLYEGPLVNILGVAVAFYPSLEPIVTILCIKDFRKIDFFKQDDRVFVQRSAQIT